MCTRKQLFFFLLILSSSFCIPAFSQSYYYHNYSVDQGLPFVQVYAIFQDSKGNIWTGGYGGLSKFDGKDFINYSPKNGLANHWVTSIGEDKDGNIWIGTITGISKFDGKKFTNYTTKDGLSGNYINAIVKDSNDKLWIGTNNGVSMFDPSAPLDDGSKKFVNYNKKNGLSGVPVTSLYCSPSGNVWMGTEKGVSKLAENKNSLSVEDNMNEFSFINELKDSTITSVCEDKSRNVWFGTHHGIIRYDGIQMKTFTVKDGLADNDIKCISTDSQNNIWVGTMKGITKFNGTSFEKIPITDFQNANKIASMHSDYEGNLWLGTYNGIYKFYKTPFTTFSENEGLKHPFIFSIFRDNQNKLWVGTDGGGVYVYDEKSLPACPPYDPPKADGRRAGQAGFRNFTEKDGVIGTQVNAGMQDKNGRYWFGTTSGLVNYDPAAGDGAGRKKFTFKKGTSFGMKNDSVTSIIQDSKGRIWLGGHNGGVYIENGKYIPFELKGKEKDFDVWCTFEDSKGNIWLGTYLGGLFCFNPALDDGAGGKTFEDYSAKLNLKSKSYLAIEEDKHENLYFGSLDGVHIYNPQKNTISNISEKDGLSSDLVYLMGFDKEYKKLWIGTNQAINIFDTEEYLKSGKIILQHKGKEEGFTGVETNANGFWRDADGTMWFGTVNGLIKYNPDSTSTNTSESKTSITKTYVFYNDTILPANAELPYDMNNIAFEYIGICMTNPEKVKYKRMLEGFEKSMSPETKENSARYSNLPPGTYTFKVISCNNEGVWNKYPAVFTFTILTPWWETWWFFTLASVTVLGLAYTVIRVRIQQIKKKNEAILKRKMELASNELKALRAQMNPHFIFNSLNSIQSFIMSSEQESAAKYLNKFARLIRTILQNSEKPSVTVKEELESLKLYLELEQLRFDEKFDYIIEVDKEIDQEFFEIPTMLIQPYVENAVLHGLIPKQGKGKLEIKICLKESHMICSITDDGIGRKKSREMKKKSSVGKHESMGMKITRDRLEMLNAMNNSNLILSITDNEDENHNALGTKVEIFIPVQ